MSAEVDKIGAKAHRQIVGRPAVSYEEGFASQHNERHVARAIGGDRSGIFCLFLEDVAHDGMR